MKVDRLALLLLLGLPCASPAAPEVASNRYALVIGIKDYPKFPAGEQLKYSDSDAKMFANFLESDASGAFPHDHVRLLLNENATQSNIYKEIDGIGRLVNSDDIVYIYFAGHGLVDDSSRAFFMPYDGDPNLLSGTGLRADRFMQDLREKIGAKHLLFFLDACHSGAVYSPSGVTIRGTENFAPVLHALWQALPSSSTELNMAFLSTAANQKSIEDDVYKHGVFTYYLMEGLKGAADDNHDGRVTAQELREYVSKQVAHYAQSISMAQTPTFSPAFDPNFVLSIYGVPAAGVAESGKLRAIIHSPTPDMNEVIDRDMTIPIDLCAFDRGNEHVVECVTHGACRGPGSSGLGFLIDKTSKESAIYTCKQSCVSEAKSRNATCNTPPPTPDMNEVIDRDMTIPIDLCAFDRGNEHVVECVTHGACRGPGSSGLGFPIDKTSKESAIYTCKQSCVSEAKSRSATCITPPPF